jgi:hemoglobin-like flavoprotein
VCGVLLNVDLQAKIASITGKHETELAVLKERTTHLQRTMNRLEQDYALKQAALAGASSEFAKKMEQQEAVSEHLIKVEAKRVDAAEREAVDAR